MRSASGLSSRGAAGRALIKAGKTLSYAQAEVRGADGRLVAHGTSMLMRLPGLGVKLGLALWAE